ncbi:trypsin-like serine peptidase [Nitratifractor sp.]
MKNTFIYSMVALMGLGVTANAGVSVKGAVTSYEVGQERSSQSVDLSRAKAMEKRLPLEMLDYPMVNKALIGDEESASKRRAVAEKGSVGSGLATLSKTIPLTQIESEPEVVPEEYGNPVKGINFPYTTSRVDMYRSAFSRKYPYRAAGQLFFKEGEETYVCSAALIKRGLLVTAAHCVANYGKQQFYSGWRFVPARKGGSAPYGIWDAQDAYIMTKYYKGASDECISGVVCKDDVAVIVLEPQDGKYPGDTIGWFGYGYGGYSYIKKRMAQITQLGYPVSHDSGRLMQRNDSLGVKGNSKYKFNTLIGSRMTGGSSGGPWIVNFGQRSQLSGTTFGHAARPNIIVGVTSWGYKDSKYKIQGASPFTKSNIKILVKEACKKYPDACRK